MKRATTVIALVALVLLFHSAASASMATDVGDVVFETTGWIVATDGVNLPFVADVAPYTYLVKLSDLSEPDNFGFDFLFLSITTASDVINSIVGPGEFTFAATPGETYFVNVFGIGGGELDAGLFGVEITAVPIPGAALLLGSGLFGLVLIRRRKH